MNKPWLRVYIADRKHPLAKKLLEKCNGRPLSEVVQAMVAKALKEDGRRRQVITVEELISDDVFLLSDWEILEVLNRLRRAENALIEELSRRLGNAQAGGGEESIPCRGGGGMP